MPWIPAAAMAAGSIASALLSKGGKGGGGGMGTIALNTDAYGLSAVPDPNGGFSVALNEKNTPERQNRLMRTARTFADLDTLRTQLSPGFGALSRARSMAIGDAASKATSNLRDSLSRRRIAGSRFGDDAMASVEAEFGKLDAEARAQSVIEEISLTSSILDQENKYLMQQVEKNLAELGIATQFAGSINNANAVQNNINKQLAAQSATAKGSFWGQFAGLAGTAVGSYFGGPAGGAAGGAAGSGLAGLFGGGGNPSSTAHSIGLQALTQGPTQYP